MGIGGITAICARARVARAAPLFSSDQVYLVLLVRLHGVFQSNSSRSDRESLRLVGLAVAIRDQSGTDNFDDREIPQRLAVAADAEVPVHLERSS